MPNRELISVIIPCHNESQNLRALFQSLREVCSAEASTSFEFIFVDDGSTDDTVSQARGFAETDPRVRVIELVRNFGKEIAITAGLHAARGQAAICLDADLQHPPALIPDFISRWRAGYEVVIGVRGGGQRHAPLMKRVTSKMFYKLINRISTVKIVANATDYRLLDRAVINEFNRFTERNRITRGLIDWLGFRRSYIEFTPARRHAGEAAYSYLKLIGLAINSVVSMSLFPLKLAGYLGGVIMLVSGPLGLFIFVEKYAMHDVWGMNFSGPAILAVILLFLVGIILVSLGLMALYIATIHAEVMNRPLYVARREAMNAFEPRRMRETVEV
ncbi:MAG TPA: glycosyltransferase family 2 protein [Candidatus Saccharimonadia bacterium]|jgi:dolichol-phosphate mannosyltransferase|nr:glycosyltransferase family 2 protein [Candidatus Saccharimonadia bacterium]